MPRKRLNRHWRAFAASLAGCAATGAMLLAFAPAFAGLFLLGIYCIPANSVLPIPHEPGVLFFAKYYHPAWIALAATLGTIAVSFADYALVEAAMRHPKVSGAAEKRLFRWAVRWMQRFPFAIIVLFSMTPLPISVIRVLAPASGYPVGRYVIAQIVGRYPWFFALAWIGQTARIPTWVLLVMFPVLFGVLWWAGRRTADAEEVEVPDLTDPEHPGASRG